MRTNEGWTGVVLAGGDSRRMGQDKALLPLWPGGPTLLDHALDRLAPLVDELLVVGHPHTHGHVGPFVIPDDQPGQGPLGGLLTAMRYATHDRLLLLAVDMPKVDGALLMRLVAEMGHLTDAVVPRHGGRIEPLVGAYHRRCALCFQAMIAAGQLKMSDALDRVRTTWLDVEPGNDGLLPGVFHNVNRPEDLPG